MIGVSLRMFFVIDKNVAELNYSWSKRKSFVVISSKVIACSSCFCYICSIKK